MEAARLAENWSLAKFWPHPQGRASEALPLEGQRQTQGRPIGSASVASANYTTLMLLTRSLPPPFLLPSWSGPELALAVQRSYISTTATKRFEIRKHAYGSKELKVAFLARRASQNPEAEIQIEDEKRENDRPSHPDAPHADNRSFKPPPRSTPNSSAAFYVGKRYRILEPSAAQTVPQVPSHTKIARPDDTSPTFDEPNVIVGRQMVGQSRREASSSRETFRSNFSRDLAPESKPIEVGKDEQLTQEKDIEALGSYSTHRKLQNASKQVVGRGYRLWKPEEGLAHPENVQHSPIQAEDLLGVPQLDMAGRWDDRVQPKSRSTPSKRLPWESGNSHLQQARKPPVFPTVQSTSADVRATDTKSAALEPHFQEPLSLFDELFPEESKVRGEAVRRAEERLDKLPAFQWDLDEGFEQSWQADREKKKAKLRVIPQRKDSKSSSAKTLPYSMPGSSQVRREDATQSGRHEPSVVILEGLSKNLEESDFFRVGPKGNHIEGWTSGILKVIPARDHTTLEPLGYYYLFFSNDAAARAYMDNIFRLHNLGKSKGPSSVPFIPPPPGAIKEGETMKELLRGFSVVPRQNKLSMRLLNKPYRPGVLNLLKEGGPPAIASRRAKGDAMVLFSVDVGSVSYYDILFAVKDDGRRRNMHWKFAGGKDVDISKVRNERKPVSRGASAENPPKPIYFRAPSKYIFAMKDIHEARRFVREWHRRPFEVISRGQSEELGQERPGIVTAELLW